MKEFNKDQLLDQLEKMVEAHIRAGVQDFQNMQEAALITSGPGGGWSIVQCLEHLNTYGRHYLPLLKASLEKDNHKKTSSAVFKSGWLGNYFVKTMQPVPEGKKYKAIAKHIPADHLQAYEVVGEFIHQQEQLAVLLQKARSADLNYPRVPTSISSLITMKPGDALRFLIVHNERHLLQAKRVTGINGG